MIRPGVKEDVTELKEIWKKIFKDEDELINSFFALFSEIESYVYEDSGEIASVLYVINGEKASYLYGLATLPQYRCKGYMTELIKYSLDINEKEYVFLIPAEDNLLKYYERFGFTKISHTYAYDYDIEACELKRINFDDIMVLIGKGYEYTNNKVNFGENIIKYVLSEEEWEFYRTMINGQATGYVVIFDGKIKYYGMDSETFWRMNFKKSRDALLLIRGEHSGIEGFIPF